MAQSPGEIDLKDTSINIESYLPDDFDEEKICSDASQRDSNLMKSTM